MVGFAAVFQQKPRVFGILPPVAVMFPLPRTDVELTKVTSWVVKSGAPPALVRTRYPSASVGVSWVLSTFHLSNGGSPCRIVKFRIRVSPGATRFVLPEFMMMARVSDHAALSGVTRVV